MCNQAMLIDLDRSLPVRSNGVGLFADYGESRMYYRLSDNWTVVELDWMQLGLLILSVV